MDKELEDLVTRLIEESKEKGVPPREVIEEALRRFADNYKRLEAIDSKTIEDRAAHEFITAVYPTDVAARAACEEYYEKAKNG